MIYFLNLGFIVEQALMDIVKNYFDRMKLDDIYGNYHISVTNSHPFAHIIIEDNARASDMFPSVVITTQNDGKIPEMNNVPPDIKGIRINSEDIDSIVTNTKRNKTKINENGEVVEIKNKKGEVMTENIPGCFVTYSPEMITKLKEACESSLDKSIFALQVNTRRRDRISVEIWTENEQLKNELYEHLRIFFTSSVNMLLSEIYKQYDPFIYDSSVNGQRSNNFNFDFDVLLYGAQISFDVDYDVTQLIIDTTAKNIKEVITEAINYVKK